MDLWIIRHAESANNVLAPGATTPVDVPTGRVPDPALTELGVRQAAQLAERFEKLYGRPTHLYCSLMMRAIATAAPLSEALGLDLVAHPRAFEIGGPYEGVWQEERTHPGSPRSVLASLSGRLVLPDAATERGWYPGPMESEAVWAARAASLLAELRERHRFDAVALVTHGYFGSELVRAVVGSAHAGFHQDNTGVTLLRIADEPQVLYFNRVSHLGLPA